MIIFHLPPIAARAAVSGQPVTGFARGRGTGLPAGTFLSGISASGRKARWEHGPFATPRRPDHERAPAALGRRLRGVSDGAGTRFRAVESTLPGSSRPR